MKIYTVSRRLICLEYMKRSLLAPSWKSNTIFHAQPCFGNSKNIVFSFQNHLKLDFMVTQTIKSNTISTDKL